MTYTIGVRSLRRVCPDLPSGRATTLAPILGTAMVLAGATNQDRASALVSQWAHESWEFRTRTEFASGAAYEGRSDLGNTQAGDGRRFKGAGFIQVTGRANYLRATIWVAREWRTIRPLFGLTRRTPPNFVLRPGLLRNYDTWAAIVSALWWKNNQCNTLADKRDFVGLTKRINGGTTGLPDRLVLYRRATQVARYLVPRKA